MKGHHQANWVHESTSLTSLTNISAVPHVSLQLLIFRYVNHRISIAFHSFIHSFIHKSPYIDRSYNVLFAFATDNIYLLTYTYSRVMTHSAVNKKGEIARRRTEMAINRRLGIISYMGYTILTNSCRKSGDHRAGGHCMTGQSSAHMPHAEGFD